MRKYLRIIAILLPVFVVTLISLNLSFAQESEQVGEQVAEQAVEQVSEQAVEQVSALEFLGTVASVDTENSILVADSLEEAESTEIQEDAQKTFSISSGTLIEKDGLEAVLGDLVVGDSIKIAYTVDSNGANVAISVSSTKAE